MIKTTMISFCKLCEKPVALYEEIVDKWIKKYHCAICRKHVRTITAVKE